MGEPRMMGEKQGKKKTKTKDDLRLSEKEVKNMRFLTQGNSISWMFRKGKNAK